MGVSVFLLTWNVEGKVPRGDLQELLRRSNPAPPDVYAIGIQDMEGKNEASTSSYYSAYSFSRRNKEEELTKEEEWVECLDKTLPGYAHLATSKMDGIVLFLYIREKLTAVVENVETGSCRMYSRVENGPKGATATRFEMGGFSFCFTNCHLSPRTEQLETRDQELYVIMDNLRFPGGQYINDHDHVFLLGILNQRAEAGEVWEGFVEGEPPEPSSSSRYGYLAGRDSRVSLLPPGSDRILYRNEGSVKVQEYQAHSYYRMSDFKPVSAYFRFTFPSFVEIKNNEAWNS